MTKLSSTLTLAAVLATALTLTGTAKAIAEPQSFTITSNGSSLSVSATSITGMSGGNVNSDFCGWIAASPNHTFTINASGIVSLKLTAAQPNGGATQPFTLLIQNANDPSADPFCAIADPFSGIPAEIGGVWNPGSYKVFIGNFEQSGAAGQAAYVLKVSQ